jgi:hypothetical protein
LDRADTAALIKPFYVSMLHGLNFPNFRIKAFIRFK